MSEREEYAECAPLLAGSSQNQKDTCQPNPDRQKVMILLLSAVFLLNAASAMQGPALTQILDDGICWRYYGWDGIAATHFDCSTDSITSEVALVNNVKSSIEYIPGVLLSIPMGVLADRIGRKPVLTISLFGMVLGEGWLRIVNWWWNIFPTRYVWMSALGTCIGGGTAVGTSLIFTFIADVTPQTERANMFYLLIAGVVSFEILGGIVGSALVTRDHPWAAYMLAYGLMLTGFSLSLLLPETLKQKSIPNLVDTEHVTTQSNRSLFERILETLRKGVNTTKFIWTSRNISLMLSVFFAIPLIIQSMIVIVLYTTRKFKTKLGDATFLLSVQPMAYLMALVSLPLITKIMVDRYKVTIPKKDQILTLLQLTSAATGMALVALAPHPWVLVIGTIFVGLGSGYHTTLRSLITSLVHQNHYATLYGAGGMLQGLGGVSIGPIQALVFRRWASGPFWIAAGIFAAAVLAVSAVRLPRQELIVEDITED